MRISAYCAFALIIMLATILLYGSFLWNPIVFDDLYFFMAGTATLDQFTQHIALHKLRWLPYASIAWTAKLVGLELIYFRAQALLLHASVGIALFFFLNRLYSLSMFTSIRSRNIFPLTWISAFSATLFVLHPTAVYGAGYLIQRTIVMATLFGLLALLAYLRGLQNNQSGWLWVSTVLYFMAVMCKEHAIMLPTVMIVLALLVAPSQLKTKQHISIFLICALIAIYAIMQRLGLLGVPYEINAESMLANYPVEYPLVSSIITQCGLFFKYLGLWLLPNPAWMSADMREPFALYVISWHLLGVVLFVSYGFTATWLVIKRNQWSLLGLAMLYPWLMFLTEFSTVRIQEPFVLYRSYFWMPGIFIAMPLIFTRLSKQALAAIMAALVITFFLLSMNRLSTFSHPLLLWDDAKVLLHDRTYLPGADRIYYNHGNYLTKIKYYENAIEDYKIALNLRPDYAPYHKGLGIAYLKYEQYSLAITEFSKAVRLQPKSIDTYYGRGLAYLKLGQINNAQRDFNTACQFGWKSGCIQLKKLEDQ